jgi:hypothetical protein
VKPARRSAFAKDWRRWSLAERVAAIVILAVSLASLPAAVALNGF